jgi:serine/threonine protein kinase
MAFINCSCGMRNSTLNPRCIACRLPITEAPGSSRAPSATATPVLSIGARLGSWELGEQLGEGASARVFRARHVDTSVAAALKVMRQSADHATQRRFAREARVLSSLEHSSLATVLDVFEAQGHVCLALELSTGSTLEQRLTAGAVGTELTAVVAAQISGALATLHAAGLVHRDVKPANVLLTEQRGERVHARLIDLGLVLSLDNQLDSLRTESGMLVGSLAYAAPEVVLGGRAEPGSDVWSLGVMIFEMLAGKRPFDAPTRSGLAKEIVAGTVGQMPIAPPLSDLLPRMLSREPAARPRADELWRALDGSAQ